MASAVEFALVLILYLREAESRDFNQCSSIWKQFTTPKSRITALGGRAN